MNERIHAKLEAEIRKASGRSRIGTGRSDAEATPPPPPPVASFPAPYIMIQVLLNRVRGSIDALEFACSLLAGPHAFTTCDMLTAFRPMSGRFHSLNALTSTHHGSHIRSRTSIAFSDHVRVS